MKNNIQFNRFYKVFNFISLALVIISVLLIFFKGLNFGVDFKGLGRLKWMPKSTSEALFFDVFLECIFASMFARFLKA